ncbi:MAG: beta-ketoacyl-ACP synthase II [Bdellovibrionales bacterium]
MNVFERPPKPQRRVVVTGVGVVSPLGLDLKTTWEKALQGESGIDRIKTFNTEGYDSQIAGEVKGFNPDTYIPKKEQKKMDTFIQYSIAASDMAWNDSGLNMTQEKPERVGVYVGAGIGGLPGIEKQHTVLMERGPSRITPFFIPMVISNLAGGQISMKLGAKGPNLCLATACSTGAHCIGEAAQFIRNRTCDIMIAGGTESTVSPLAIAGFSAMKALSTRNDQPRMASRPFDKDRDGFVLGEGAAVLILEDYEHASKRGATIYAELSGYGLSGDAYHLTNPSEGGEGAARAMQMALKDSGLSPEKMNYLNAHGTSTAAGDVAETMAIKSVFGSHAKKLWISSTKSMTGHLLGAAGSLESAFCAMAVKTGQIPPTINLDNPDDQCDLDYVPHTAREGKILHAMNNSFGFGGTNASLIFSKI